jgi:hypothetical protein
LPVEVREYIRHAGEDGDVPALLLLRHEIKVALERHSGAIVVAEAPEWVLGEGTFEVQYYCSG